MEYITYDDFLENSGNKNVSEASFSNTLNIVESKINFLTNGRIEELEEIPEDVKRLCYRLVNLYLTNDTERDQTITSYSNGIESFGYSYSDGNGNSVLDKQVAGIVKEELWRYPQLLYRGRW